MTRTAFIAGLVALVALTARSDDKIAPKGIEGAWKQVESKNGAATEYQKAPEGVEMIDLIVGGRFTWTITKDGKIGSAAGGRYKIEKDKFTEIIEFIGGEGVPESFVGSTFEFMVKFEGDTMTKVGTIKVNGQDYKIDEKWERCK